jgi:hypothetical protein
MRAFDPRVSAVALGLSPKAFGNLITRLQMLPVGTSGVRRRLSLDDLRLLDITTALARQGIPAARGLRVARTLLAEGHVELVPGLVWGLDGAEHALDLEQRLAAAAGRVVARRRGRPTGAVPQTIEAPPPEGAPISTGTAGSA